MKQILISALLLSACATQPVRLNSDPTVINPTRVELVELTKVERFDFRTIFLKEEPELIEAGPEVDCLSLNIYHEARGESVRGQEAVALVTLNRAKSGRYPDNVCDVVYQGSKRRTGCQFSWTCDRRSDEPRDQTTYQRCREVAIEVLNNQVEDFTNRADHYHATSVTPRWARAFKQTIRVGTHIFYTSARL